MSHPVFLLLHHIISNYCKITVKQLDYTLLLMVLKIPVKPLFNHIFIVINTVRLQFFGPPCGISWYLMSHSSHCTLTPSAGMEMRLEQWQCSLVGKVTVGLALHRPIKASQAAVYHLRAQWSEWQGWSASRPYSVDMASITFTFLLIFYTRGL